MAEFTDHYDELFAPRPIDPNRRFIAGRLTPPCDPPEQFFMPDEPSRGVRGFIPQGTDDRTTIKNR